MCMKEGRPFAKRQLYDKIFQTEFNISFFFPKKDQCLLCESCKDTELSPEMARKLENHIIKNQLCREEKKSDIEKAKSGNNIVVCCYNQQAVLQHHVVTFLSYITNVASHAIISQSSMRWTGRVIAIYGMRDLVIELLMKLVVAFTIIWRKIAIHKKLYFITTTVLDRIRINTYFPCICIVCDLQIQ